MAGDAPKIVALTLAVATTVGVAAIWLPKLLGAAAGADTELITQLKTAERDGLQLPVLGGTLNGHRVAYQRITVTVEAGERSATVLATLDFTGQVGPTEVSSLGVEKIVFVSDGKAWKPQSSLAPRLTAVVNALEGRRRALEAGDVRLLSRLAGVTDGGGLGPEADQWLALLERKLQVDAWFIRLERDGADVSEQYRMDGFGRDRPFRSAGPRKLHLELSVGGEFFFPTGLM
jgi:hypothetical protein